MKKIIYKMLYCLFDYFSLSERDLKRYCVFERSEFPHANFSLNFDDSRVVNSFDRFNQYEQNEYIYRFDGDLYIEPITGFVISNNRILKPSLPYYYDAAFPIRNLINLAFKKKEINVVSEQVVLSLRDTCEGNYFHFFNDVYAKLALMRTYNQSDEVPIVVAKKLFDKPYFQDMLKYPVFTGGGVDSLFKMKILLSVQRQFSAVSLCHILKLIMTIF